MATVELVVPPDGKRRLQGFLPPLEEAVFRLLEEDPDRPQWGDDARWSIAVIRFVEQLFADGQWYPEVAESHPRLRPLLDAHPVRRHFRALAAAMPGSARALVPEASPAVLLAQLVKELCERLGRQRLEAVDPSHWSTTFQRLLPDQAELLEALVEGRSYPGAGRFFDPRQSTIDLKRRPSVLGFMLVPPAADRLDEDARRSWELQPQLYPLVGSASPVPALEAWQHPERVPPGWTDRDTPLRTHLLEEFGRALPLIPALGAALASSPPSSIALTQGESVEFLEGAADRLRNYGYPVGAPPELLEPQVPELHLWLKPRPDDAGPLEFRWRLNLGGVFITADELRSGRSKVRSLLPVDGRWLRLERSATLRLLNHLRKLPKHGSLLQAFGLVANSEVSIELHFEGDLQPLGAPQTFRELEPVPAFRADLRDYQRTGFSWLVFMHSLGLGACLADDMGLGKTVQTLAFLSHLRHGDPQAPPALLVCPTSILHNWQREQERFAPQLRCHLHYADRARTPEDLTQRMAGSDLVLTSYPLLNRDRKLLESFPWQTVILDEAQQIKNANSQVSRAARSLRSPGRVLLTGTPIENRLSELWSLFRFLQPELLESSRKFARRFATPIETHGDPQAEKRLKSLIGPFLLRRSKTDPAVAGELPQKSFIEVPCRLTAEQRRLYGEWASRTVSEAKSRGPSERRIAVLGHLTRLKQICNHPALLEEDAGAAWDPSRSGKLERLLELFDELPADEGVLIFSQYARAVRALQRTLTESLGEEVLRIDGSVSRDDRVRAVDRFQSRRGPRIFCLSLKSGGVGLNLTRATTVIHWDRWWNPAVENQATDRAYRIGQSKNVQVYRFLALNTIEESIHLMLQTKSELSQGLIEEGDGWLARLEGEALTALLLPSGFATTEQEQRS